MTTMTAIYRWRPRRLIGRLPRSITSSRVSIPRKSPVFCGSAGPHPKDIERACASQLAKLEKRLLWVVTWPPDESRNRTGPTNSYSLTAEADDARAYVDVFFRFRHFAVTITLWCGNLQPVFRGDCQNCPSERLSKFNAKS